MEHIDNCDNQIYFNAKVIDIFYFPISFKRLYHLDSNLMITTNLLVYTFMYLNLNPYMFLQISPKTSHLAERSFSP